MLGPAPAITMLLILITQKSVFYAITIKDVEVNIQKSLITLLLFTTKAIKRIKGIHCYSTSNLSNNNNNNKFKIFMGIIIFLISLLNFSDLNSLLVLLSGLTVKGLVKFYCIMTSFFYIFKLIKYIFNYLISQKFN